MLESIFITASEGRVGELQAHEWRQTSWRESPTTTLASPTSVSALPLQRDDLPQVQTQDRGCLPHISHPTCPVPGGCRLVLVSIPETKAIQGSFSLAETLPSQNPLLVKAPVELGGSVGGAAGLPAASADVSAGSTFLSTQGACTGPCLSSGPELAHLACKWSIHYAEPLTSQQRSARDL